MKRALLIALGLVTLAALPASAADLGRRLPTKAPPMAAEPVWNWTGFYIGVNGGAGWARSEHFTNLASTGLFNQSGGMVGGTVGYNWQAGNIVYGLEADGGWADVDASVTALGITAKSKTDALGTVRGRIGFAVDQVLFYGTGGYAWIDNKISLSALGVTVSQSNFHSGWTVGAGIEAFFAPQWSVKGEYLYRDLGSETYFGIPSGDLKLHSVQVGVNYHFGGPIVAKY